jgi:hypothetical protein
MHAWTIIIIIHLIIRAPSRVSPQTFVNFVYLYVNKLFTTQTDKSGAQRGHDVKSGATSWGMMLNSEISPDDYEHACNV